MAQQSRPKPSDVVSVCYGIHSATKEVVTVWVKRDGSYAIGADTRFNQHNNPIEFELSLIHGITDTVCFVIGQLNDESTKAIRAQLEQKAAAMKAKE